jgi:tetratricopeptide (TPR) repeat protein
VAQAVGDGLGAAYARLWLAVAAWQASDPVAPDPVAARTHLEASRHGFQTLGYPALAAEAVMVLGVGAHEEGDPLGAARRYAEAEALARPAGDIHVLAHIVGNQAWLARRQGDYPLARRLWEEALALRAAQRDRRGISDDLRCLGSLALAEGDSAAARARLTEALTVLQDAGHVWSMPRLLRGLAQVAAAQGQLRRAARLWGAGEAHYQAITGRPPPADRRLVPDPATESLRALRAMMDEEALSDAWAAGQEMSLEQAVAYALEDDCAAAPAGPEQV